MFNIKKIKKKRKCSTTLGVTHHIFSREPPPWHILYNENNIFVRDGDDDRFTLPNHGELLIFFFRQRWELHNIYEKLLNPTDDDSVRVFEIANYHGTPVE